MTSRLHDALLAILHYGLILTVSGVSGSLSALLVVSHWPTSAQTENGEVTTSSPTTTAQLLTLMPLDLSFQRSTGLPILFQERATAVASIYRSSKGSSVENWLTSDRLVGRALIGTSDGWFIAPASFVQHNRLADLVVWFRGSSYAIDRAIVDRSNGIVYLKTPASGGNAPAFAPSENVDAGMDVWMEMDDHQFVPKTIVDDRARSMIADAANSEVVLRRYFLNSPTEKGAMGSPVWNEKGMVIGVVESAENEPLRVVPAVSISTGLDAVLRDGEVRRASLGVRTMDLGVLRKEKTDELPSQGAWVRVVTPPVTRLVNVLKVGDVILAVERDILNGSSDLGEILSVYRPETTVTLRVKRDKTELEIPVKLGKIVTSEVVK